MPLTPAVDAPNVHSELLLACERTAHIWSERAKSEAGAWTAFKAKVLATHDADDALKAYMDFSAQRMLMATEDVRRLFEEYQDITGKFLKRG